MHELSLCRSIATIVERARRGQRVERVGIKLGALRQAVPETLSYCWQVVTKDTALEGSALDFEIVPLAIRCRACSAEAELNQLWLRCPRCQGSDVEVIRGEEFMVTTIDVAGLP